MLKQSDYQYFGVELCDKGLRITGTNGVKQIEFIRGTRGLRTHDCVDSFWGISVTPQTLDEWRVTEDVVLWRDAIEFIQTRIFSSDDAPVWTIGEQCAFLYGMISVGWEAKGIAKKKEITTLKKKRKQKMKNRL
jgi:hypothetical protein